MTPTAVVAALPLLALPVVFGAAITLLLAPPANGVDVVIAQAVTVAGFVAVQSLHLRLIYRWSRSQEPGVPMAG